MIKNLIGVVKVSRMPFLPTFFLPLFLPCKITLKRDANHLNTIELRKMGLKSAPRKLSKKEINKEIPKSNFNCINKYVLIINNKNSLYWKI